MDIGTDMNNGGFNWVGRLVKATAKPLATSQRPRQRGAYDSIKGETASLDQSKNQFSFTQNIPIYYLFKTRDQAQRSYFELIRL